MNQDQAHRFELLLRLGDDHLILGHRLSEWCGHGPMLEEDLALANLGLDLLGQARLLLSHAGEVEGRGRDEDHLAYLRLERDYRHCLLVERPNGDFAHTMLRQLYFAAFMRPYWAATIESRDPTLGAIAAKAVKEIAYHLRHTSEWVIRLGDGTGESAARMQAAVEALHPYCGELLERDEVTEAMAAAGIAPDPESLRPAFETTIEQVFAEARLALPDTDLTYQGGRKGRHGEELGHLLAELQYLQRTFPGQHW
jgi:ring-1,2-phenylacetyl-CoA epoxidase subunit PaaC